MTEQDKINKRIVIEKKLAEYDGEDKVISSNELFKILIEKSKTKRFVSLQSGLPTLDNLIHSFDGGELTTISGTTGHGKTLLAQTFTANFAERGKLPLWFTYEVSALQFLRQFGENIPHFYMPSMLKSTTLEWIYQRILETKLKYGVEAVFIDHLHFLADIMMSNYPSMDIGRVMRKLKSWCVELNICFFLIAHTTKIKMDKADKELELGDIRDSSFVEQESDNVFYLWRKKKNDTEATLKIVKNRRFGVRDKKILIHKEGNFLKETEFKYEDD